MNDTAIIRQLQQLIDECRDISKKDKGLLWDTTCALAEIGLFVYANQNQILRMLETKDGEKLHSRCRCLNRRKEIEQ